MGQQQSSSAQGAIAVECLLAALLCAYLVRLFAAPVTTLDVKLTVFLAWWLGMAGVLLLPLDLSFAFASKAEQYSPLTPMWQFIYWSTFVLAWVILPLQHDYHRSGYFLPLEKLRDAVRRNVFFYASIGLLGLVYIVIAALNKKSNGIGIGFLMALGNTYGILLLCFFMGNGLVGLPVRLWQMSDAEGELQRLYLAAPAVEASYQEARFELEDCVAEVQKCGRFIYTHAAPSRTQLLGNVDVLLAVVGAVSPSLITSSSSSRTSSSSLQQLLSDVEDKTGTEEESLAKYNTILVQLHARLKRSHMLALVTSRKWRLLCSRAQRLGGGGSGGEQHNSGAAATAGKHGALKTLSVCSALLSVVVIWSELVMASSLSSPIGLVLVSLSSYNPVWVQTVSFLTLAYVSTCAYWSLFRGNLFGLEYVVSSPQLSPPAALIVNGEYFTRLQFSVGFNFLLLLNSKQRLTSDSVAFLGLLRNMETIPLLGTSFTVYAPICLVVVSLLTLCNGYGKLLSFLGVESFAEDSNTSISSCIYGAADLADEDRLTTGKRMVRAEWRAQELASAAAAAASAAAAAALKAGHNDTVVISPLPSSSASSTSTNVKLELPNVRRLDVKVRGGGYLGVGDESEGRGSGGRGRVESWGLGEEDDEEDGGGGGGGRYRD